MPIEITMPQLSDTMHDGKILNWHKSEGDAVKRGDALAEVETDKADLEIESFHEGTLVKILTPAGEKVQVGAVIAILAEAGESTAVQSSPKATSAPASTPVSPPRPSPVETVQKPQPLPEKAATQVSQKPSGGNGHTEQEERIKISPLARNIAQSHGVDVSNISGTGDGGRIVRRDIEAQISNAPSPSAKPASSVSEAPARQASAPQVGSGQALSKMRQAIATRMQESASTIPHFYVTTKMCVDELKKLRETLKPLAQYEGLTYTHMILKACGLALRAVPRINANYSGETLVQPSEINIGIITAVPDGLLIPVVHGADTATLADIVSESRGLVARARSGKPKSTDLVGGTFSISNMGLFAVESFTAIINPGQGAILAVSAIAEEPVVKKGEVVAGSVLRVTLSVDHRIIDGVVAGEFLTELKRLIEEPVLLLA